jgi:hypothetical protein
MSTVCFYAQETTSKDGLNGITVTWNIHQVTRLTGARTKIVSGGATNISFGEDGLYGYMLENANLILYDYLASAITADATADLKRIPSLQTFWALSWHDVATSALTLAGSFGKLVTDFLDVAVSSRLATAGYTAPSNSDIAAIKVKTDNLPTDPADQSAVETAITAATSPLLATASYTAPDNASISLIKVVTDKINGMLELFSGAYRFTVAALVNAPSGGAVAQEVWEYADRTLTNPLVSYTNIPAANTINAGIGETIEISITGLGDLAGRDKLYWTLKRANGSPDSAAIVQIEETDGLIILNGSGTIPGGVVGTLVVDDEGAGDVTISLEAELSTLLPVLQNAKWDIKYVSATVKSVKAKGRMNLSYNTTEAIE